MKKVIFVLFLLIACTPTFQNYVEVSNIKIPVEIANTPEARAQGLMFRTELSGGMFFVFEETKNLNFWMKNTLIPLDIIFIDENFKIVDLKENFLPCEKELCEVYTSKPAKYALEVNAGFVKENKIKINAVVKLLAENVLLTP